MWEQWLVVTMLADAGIDLIFSVAFLIKARWYIENATTQYPTGVPALDAYLHYQSNMVQGRGLMVAAWLIFGALYHDTTVRMVIAGVVVAWCLYLILCTTCYGYEVQHTFGSGSRRACSCFANDQAIYLCIILGLFAALHSVGIVLTAIG